MCVAEEKNEENRRVSVLKRTFLKYASIDDNGDKYMSLEDLIECLQPHMNISKEKLKVHTFLTLTTKSKISSNDKDSIREYCSFFW